MANERRLQILSSDLETALSSLTKLLKGLIFYPVGHPSLNYAAAAANRRFQALLKQHGAHTYRIADGVFWLEEIPLTTATKRQQIGKLAQKLQNLGVAELTLLPGLTEQELLYFTEELSKPLKPERDADDFAIRLSQHKIEAIQVRGPKAALLDTPETQLERMQNLLEELKEPQDKRSYRNRLEQVEQLAEVFFERKGITGCLAVLTLLISHSTQSTRPAQLRQLAEKSLATLLTPSVCQTLTEAIADPKLKASQYRALTRLATGCREKLTPLLLQRLYAERDALVRRKYTAILAQLGETIFDLLKIDLHSEIWHVVRNVVNILGKTGLETAVPLLQQVIGHPETRVRRAVIRALGAIGSDTVIYPLFHLAQDPDHSLQQPAIRALGNLKNPQAVQPLVELLSTAGPFTKPVELKLEIVQALAASEAPQAIIPLLKLARQQNLLNRQEIENLRAEAILALGQLGNNKLLPILERLPRQNKAPVSRAIQQATAQLRKSVLVAGSLPASGLKPLVVPE